ncbi:tetratricopeptide repeat protein [Legionella oakridgensis]|uniref:Cytochrome c biogenesis factor CcmH n=2 Tax=Legionella oakridgensis TaxID=29423 RepID=W0BEI2_9GAMM|nr:tetratricopeptide repeat protein [Legionella oakridgensis]AHE66809.1 cytochrome c biogenesis factor CcmH [Legionella oakridgensis ATCC 33761 = DSM 21215]ETO93521.1 cytochrome c biogenesis factor [Legionella oakridgensis RV-2-2007]KTD39795.1 cytochrome c-type biogenesis protein [Legionella oakridgensis]STY19925.1 cytochrome c-type biogenesis protein [Legionella longbeachae]
MNEWWLYVVFLGLLILALGMALYPLRKDRALILTMIPLLIILVASSYWRWGGWSGWQEYSRSETRQQQVRQILKSIQGPQELIDKLKAQLNKQPDSARGWYLLGRLYVSQNEWQQAYDAFARAHRLMPQDEKITINYAQSRWQVKQRQFDDTTRNLFKSVLQQDANQPDALAMLAMDAFMSHDYQLAVDYWQRLLRVVPPESDDAKAIRKAIAKAQQSIQ